MDRPSYRVEPGVVVAVAERNEPAQPVQVAATGAHAEAPESWTYVWPS